MRPRGSVSEGCAEKGATIPKAASEFNLSDASAGQMRGMIQLLFGFIGVMALVKGELKVTAQRTLKAERAHAVGLAFLLLAGLGLFLNITGPTGILGFSALGIALACLAFAISEKSALPASKSR